MQSHAQEMYTDQQVRLRHLAANLDTMELAELQAVWKRVYGQRTFVRSRTYLRRLLGYRFQELAEHGRPHEVRGGIVALARHAPSPEPALVPVGNAKVTPTGCSASDRFRDPRLPRPGTALRRQHGGQLHEVIVGEYDCLYAGERYRSLSAVAVKISGGSVNGFAFFARALREAGAEDFSTCATKPRAVKPPHTPRSFEGAREP